MSATVGAALKQVAVGILTDKKNWERLGCLVLAILLMFLLPTMAVQAVFTGADFATESPEFRQAVAESLSVKTVAGLTQAGITMEAVELGLTAMGLEDQITQAQVLYALFLYEKSVGDPLFVPKFVACFSEEQSNAQLIARVNVAFGTEISANDFSHLMSMVHPEIVSLALSQLGNEGGEPFWSWYGFPKRVEWCACFVSWCANRCGYIQSGDIPMFSGCETGANWFKARDRWLDKDATPSPGMIVFFDWLIDGTQDGSPDHVGIVEKVENGYVYTVEGNSGDAVRQCRYAIGYFEIYGYGTYGTNTHAADRHPEAVPV